MQNIQELNKEKMDIMKELAAVNIKVSEAQNVIFKLQEDETAYLEEREKKAMVRIAKVLEDSKNLLDKTHENYDEIHSICQSVTTIADFVSETYGKISELLAEFKRRNDAWDKDVEKREQEIAEINKKILVDQTIIANDKKTIEIVTEKLRKDNILLEDRRATLKRAFERLDNEK